MKKSFTCLPLLVLIAAIPLTGCGGATSPSALTPAYDYQKATRELVLSGHTENVSVSMTGSKNCSGSGIVSYSPAEPAQFNITPAQQIAALTYNTTMSWTWGNCEPADNTGSSSTYLNANDFAPLGQLTQNTYGVFLTPPDFPKEIKSGDAGSIGLMTLYSDATETVEIGTENIVYSVTFGVNGSLIITTTTNLYDASHILNNSAVAVLQLTPDSKLRFISETISYPATGDMIWIIAT